MPTPNLSIGELAVAIRVADDMESAMLEPTLATAIAQIASGAIPIIEAYAGDDTPQHTLDLALIRFTQAVYDAPPQARRGMENFFTTSGAKSMLSSWHVPRSEAAR